MKRKVVYVQEDASSCGSICIQSVVSYYGGYVPLETVIDDTSTTMDGTNAYEIIRTLRKYGFTSYGRKVGLDKIEFHELPVIAHVVRNGLEHFLVIYEIQKDKIVTMDPEYGEKVYKRTDFEMMFDEKIIFLFPEGEIPKYEPSKTLLNCILKLAYANRKTLTIILAICLLSLVLSLLSSYHLKFLSIYNKPIELTLLFLGVRLMIFMSLLIKEHLIEFLMGKLDDEITSTVTDHIFHLPMRFLNRKKVGEIIRKVDDATFIKDLIMRLTVVCSIDILMLFLSGSMIIYLSKELSLIYFTTAIISAVTSWILTGKNYKKNREVIGAYDDYMGTLVEYTKGLESIKNLSGEAVATEELKRKMENYISQNRHLTNRISDLYETKSYILDTGVILANLVGFMTLSENFSFYDLITVSSLFGLFAASLQSLLDTQINFIKGKSLYRTISEFLDIEEEPQTGIELNLPFDKLEIRNFSYSYDNVHQNIRNLSFDIYRGDKILIEGPSGIGKSTLVKCLCGYLDNYEGHIRINGKDIRRLKTASLKKNIIYIGQEEMLFSGTIEKNIVGREADENRLKEVIDCALLKEIIDGRIEGINSTILEGASNISGGERSRIILARALYKKPSILIIDETLASVSEPMEDEILKRLLAIDNLTVLYITHRNKRHLFKKIIKFKEDNEYEFRNC